VSVRRLTHCCFLATSPAHGPLAHRDDSDNKDMRDACMCQATSYFVARGFLLLGLADLFLAKAFCCLVFHHDSNNCSG
jgi:hypothetical protein